MAEQAEQVGKRLTEARTALGLTRPQMAARFEETSVTDDYIYRWETGRVMPSEAYQGAVIAHYELDGLADLFGGPKADRTKPPVPKAEDFSKLNGKGPAPGLEMAEVLERVRAIEARLQTEFARNAEMRSHIELLVARSEPGASGQK